MPKLLQITVDGNAGSTGQIAEGIGKLAIARGWESYIAHGRYTRPSESKTIKIGSDFEVFVHGILTRFFDRHGLGSKRATIKLINEIKVIKPDVIQLHNLHGYYINIEVLFKYFSKSNTPVIMIFHDFWTITGHCCHFDFVKCEKWRTGCYDCPQKKEYPASLFVDRSRKNYKLKKELFTSVPNLILVSVSKWVNNIAGESFLGHFPSHVIYNGVDIDVFTPEVDQLNVREKLNIGRGFMILGVATPWSKRKGLADFIKLSQRLRKTDIIVLVGLDKSQINVLPPNIIGIKRTENRKALKDLYATADVYLNLSMEETFGLTTAEALSCGTPSVVYNATACPELVDENSGLVVEKNDIQGLIDAIDIIRRKGKDFYSAACRTRALTHFNKDDRFKEYVDLHETLLTSKIGGGGA